MVTGSARISLGTCLVFLGLGLFILLRGDSNDAYAGVLVCSIALLQLFDYGVWRNLECNPGGSNDRATRGLYMYLWLMPAVLCFAAAGLATEVFADQAGRMFLYGMGGVFALLCLALFTVIYDNKLTMCSAPGSSGQLKYGFLNDEKVPIKPNLLLLAGLLVPTLLVDPFMLGLGTIGVAIGSYVLSKQFDPLMRGEWLTAETLLMNGVGVWALLVPAIKRDLAGLGGTY